MINDSSTTQILDALRQATACEVVIIDLEEGQAWWETRLLVLLAGAVRLKKPEKMVFIGTDGGVKQGFQGWGYVRDLLPCLLRAHPQYLLSYHRAMAAGREWSLVEPSGSPGHPVTPTWIHQGLATQHTWMAFESTTGLPNPLFPEQLLASDLGDQVESQEQPKRISLVRLEELFRPVLHQELIEESWPVDQQLQTFFESDVPYLAVTQNNQYTTLVSRLTILNSLVQTLVQPKAKHGSK